MTDIVTVYWRDIPAQVLVGRGRSGAKVQLPERFEQAIDRAAMRSGAAGTDAYLAEWRRVPGTAPEAAPVDAAAAEAARLDAAYDRARIKALIEGGGWARVETSGAAGGAGADGHAGDPDDANAPHGGRAPADRSDALRGSGESGGTGSAGDAGGSGDASRPGGGARSLR